jgi:hypothetical protein
MYIQIPPFISDKPTPQDYKNPSYYISALRSEEERVCEKCYNMVQNRVAAHGKIIELFKNPVDINSLTELPCDASDYYRHTLSNIQYVLPNHTFTDIERKILLVNMKHLSGHSKYLAPLLKVVPWPKMTSEDIEEILSILKAPRIKGCEELFCTGTCGKHLKFDDILNILYSTAGILPEPIVEYLFSILNTVHCGLILCGMPFLCNLIPPHKRLHKHLCEIFTRDIKLLYKCYWHLSIIREFSTPTHSEAIGAFIALMDNELVIQMHREYLFYVNLIDSLDNLGVFFSDRMKIPIRVPFDPDLILYRAHTDEIEVKSSHTKPVIIPFDSNRGKIKLIFKRESVANDECVLNLIEVINMILKPLLNTNEIVTYSAMPLTATAGVIEYVEEAETIHKIISEKITISQYLMDENDDENAPSISAIKTSYMTSLVGYTLIGYLLGLGDRHLQNVMITRRGSLFHIDFTYIMGKNSHTLLTGSEMQLTCDMISVIGGVKKEYYQKYLHNCSAGILILKKYFNLFFIALSQTQKPQEVQSFVLSRFQPRQTDSVIVNEITTIIEKSYKSNPDIIRDFLHYHTQEFDIKTLITGVSNALKFIGVVGLL